MLEDLIQLHQAGRFAEAEDGYRQLLAGDPDNAEALHLLGILRAQRGDLREAYELVQRASELAPENAASQHTLGEMYLSEGKLDEARQAYDRARQLNPNLASAHAGLGQVAFLRGDIDGAEAHFRVALRADENDVQALTGLGNVAQWRGDSARALQLLTQAAALAPGDALIQASYARAMLDEGMLDFAGRALDNALAAKPDYAPAQALRADLHVRKGDFAAARPMFESLLARGEQIAAAHTGQGDIARAKGLHDEAIAHYDQALRAQPDLHHAAIRRADSLARSGRAVQAIDDLRWYVAVHPDSAKAHIGLAQLLSQTARYDESIEVWSAAEARWPDNHDIRAQHALTLDQAGRSDEALAKAELAAASPRPALAMLRARGALLAGDPAAAVQRLQRIDDALLEGRPLLARRRERLLGLAFDGLEQWSDAVDAFLRAQRMGPVRLPDLPSLDEGTESTLRQQGSEPELADARGLPPILLCGLPGSGVGQVAALLADQPGWFVRRERFEAMPDFISTPFDPRFALPLDQAALAVLARRYRRPLERAQVPEATQVVDWLPVLDARIVPVVRRALPGTRLVIVAREPQDMLVDWLAFGWSQGYSMPDALTGARWMRLASAHLDLAARMLPVFRADPDALLAKGGSASRRQLGEFLGLRDVAWGPLARGARRGRGGLPVSFTAGHAAHYREVLSEAFAALES